MDLFLSRRVFCEVVEKSSFVAAAHRLKLSTAMASKHVAALERSLDSRLLNRTSRHVSLTEAGRLYYEQCREALEILDAAEAQLTQAAEAPKGLLRVTAPVWCANARFAHVLAAYRTRYPEVIVEMTLENRRVDLVAEGYDVAIRATAEPSGALIVRRIAENPFARVASTEYLARHPPVRTLADLEGLEAIFPTYVDISSVMLETSKGRVPLKNRVAFRTNDSTLVLELARAGVGLAYLPRWVVESDLATGVLVEVLPEIAFPKSPLYAVYTSRRYLTPKVRTFIDFVIEQLNLPTQCG